MGLCIQNISLAAPILAHFTSQAALLEPHLQAVSQLQKPMADKHPKVIETFAESPMQQPLDERIIACIVEVQGSAKVVFDIEKT